MRIDDRPRVRLAHLPTPFESLTRLSAHLGGPRIFVKRDDQTGLAGGGNKARKLEFLVAQALDQGCDTLVTTGGPQSNHARQTAAAAARYGLRCELLLPRVVPWAAPEYETSGNLLLDRLLGAGIHLFDNAQFSQATIDEFLARLRSERRKPYFIPVGGSTALGALGYAVAADELLAQAGDRDLRIDAIVVPTGSAGTHAGILAGLIAAGHPAVVQGMAVSGTSHDKETLVNQLTAEALELLGQPGHDPQDRVRVDDRYVGPGYGLPTPEMTEAVELVARIEGLLLDPVYTGKAMAGLIAAVREGTLTADANVVFWHTGGTPALYAYTSVFTR